MFEPVERDAAAVLQLRDHRGRRLVVLVRADAFRFFRREHLTACITPQPLEFIHSRTQRRLPDDAHQSPRFLLRIYFPTQAFRAAVAVLQLPVSDPDLACSRECGCGLRPCPACLVRLRGCGRARIADVRAVDNRAGLLRAPSLGKQFGQRMQRRPELLVIAVAEGFGTCVIRAPDPVRSG